ncbi:MAG: DUF3795 domain-containing protein [Oscillospiraceae bacterium]|nr:DUF3795 domain-containing protein [Oscillospiraceae bacterium]
MEIISCCGIMCGECPVYIATEKNDEQMKRFLALKFSESGRELAPEDINCRGCLSADRENDKFRGGCEVRSCCRENSVRLCAECRKFPCEKADRNIPQGTEHRARLEEMHEACKELLQ